MRQSQPATVIAPQAVVWRDETPIVAFAEFDLDQLLTSPFWPPASRTPRRRIRRLLGLDELAPSPSSVRVAGFIYHMTRCGSTLVTRMLSTLPRVVAISEPFAFQQLLAHPDPDPARRARRLTGLLNAHRAALEPIADAIVIKWSAMMGLYATEIEAALTETPSVFLYRNPADVLASIEAKPLGGRESLGPEHFGAHAPASLDRCIEVEFWARALAAVCDRVAQARTPRTLSYDQLPAAAWTLVASYFGLRIDEQCVGAMRRVAGIDAKDPAGQARFDLAVWSLAHPVSSDAARLSRAHVAPALERCLAALRPLDGAPPGPSRDAPIGGAAAVAGGST